MRQGSEEASTEVPESPTAIDANPEGKHRKPDSEKISSRRSSLLDDLPSVIRTSFERARSQEVSDAGASSSGQFAAREASVAFMSTRGYKSRVSTQKLDEPSSSGVLNFRNACPDLNSKIGESRLTEWKKYQHFTASIPIKGTEFEALFAEGHVVIPSKWVDTTNRVLNLGTRADSLDAGTSNRTTEFAQTHQCLTWRRTAWWPRLLPATGPPSGSTPR